LPQKLSKALTESLAIKPYEYLDTLPNSGVVNVTLDTDYRELWENTLLSSSVVDDLGFSGTVSFGSDKIYISTSAPKYLKFPKQTATGPLHAGMISCSVEDPDGDGGDDDDLTGYLEADTDYIVVTGVAAKKNEVRNLYLTNIGGRTITIDYVKTSWDPDEAETLDHIVINTKVVTDQTLAMSSGMWVILSDIAPAKGSLPVKIIEPNAQIKMDFIFVSGDIMTNKDFTIGLLLNDGSVKIVNFST